MSERFIPPDASPALRQALDAVWDKIEAIKTAAGIDMKGAPVYNSRRSRSHDQVVVRSELKALEQKLTQNIAISSQAAAGSPTGGEGEDDGGEPTGNQCPRTPPGAYEVPVGQSIFDYVASAPAGVFEVGVTPPTLVNNTTAAVAYVAGVVSLLNNGGYGIDAQPDPGDGKQLQVKASTGPTFSEDYAIWVSDTLQIRRPPGAYRATCRPPSW